jgi:hypothetical protein
MVKPYDPTRYHRVTLDTRGVKVLSKPRPEQQPSSVYGPFNLSGYLFCFPEPFAPGGNAVAIYLETIGHGIRAPVTVTGSVTELSPPSTPIQGAARFWTQEVKFDGTNFGGKPVGVIFFFEWDSPLHVAVMLTIGQT